jgi:hypothetical protein
MSAIKDYFYDIEQLYIEGFNSRAIATELDCPIEIVLGVLETMSVADPTQETEEIYSPYYGA